ncbi:MAG: polyketide cyclase [Elusimicrobia bacterium RIFCSPLOWO2_01_FULL_54_10]|nr:MAG: polyketide cyclase [Elusimicrobia bacterium RIFCSPLOWO2_01_FULL_54_10]
MIKKILIGLVVVVGVFAAYVAKKPSHYSVTRSTVISAPASVVFPHVNDLSKWEAWSPWAKKDPQAKTTLEGPKAGVGAISRWAGNKDVGEGSMTITESKSNELIRIRLDFLKPMKSTSDVEFTFKAQDKKNTSVTWTMSGESNFIGKAMCTFMGDMDKMVGGDFEAGLAGIKSIAEAQVAPKTKKKK